MRPDRDSGWRDAGWDDDESEVEGPLYRDPFDDSGPCRRILALPEEVRGEVRETCPRCGSAGEAKSWLEAERTGAAPAGPCILEGVDLDVMAYDDGETLKRLRAKLRQKEETAA